MDHSKTKEESFVFTQARVRSTERKREILLVVVARHGSPIPLLLAATITPTPVTTIITTSRVVVSGTKRERTMLGRAREGR